jgi:hypothetical protein
MFFQRLCTNNKTKRHALTQSVKMARAPNVAQPILAQCTAMIAPSILKTKEIRSVISKRAAHQSTKGIDQAENLYGCRGSAASRKCG